jgi:uncharacterized repeat protein (TIGR02543 family)
MNKKLKCLLMISVLLFTGFIITTCEGPMGPQGEQGKQGEKGEAGNSENTPVITIDPITGNWIINGINTGISATGPKGDTGNQGIPGNTPVITIDPVTGNWVIDGINTGISATGSKGDTGNKGESGNNGLNSYLVIFNANGGRPRFDMIGVTHGQTVAQPNNPTRNGMNFIGWYTDNTSFSNQWDFETNIVTTNINLYARWFEPFTNIVDIASYLATQVGTVENPVFLSLKIDLGNMPNVGSGWQQLLDIIANANQFVSLDLSACTMSDTTFKNRDGNVSPAGMDRIVSIVLPEIATSIGDHTFKNCIYLKSITLPAGLTSIGFEAFFGCTSLTQITLPIGLNSISGWAFSKTNLVEITLPIGITSISNGLFHDNKSLSKVLIPDGVTSIGDWAFLGCTSLAEIILPTELISIGDAAFNTCTSLIEITLPIGLAFIDERAFQNCTSLTRIICLNPTPPILNVFSLGGIWFNNTPSDLRIEVPIGRASVYRTTANWNGNGIRNRIHSIGCPLQNAIDTGSCNC